MKASTIVKILENISLRDLAESHTNLEFNSGHLLAWIHILEKSGEFDGASTTGLNVMPLLRNIKMKKAAEILTEDEFVELRAEISKFDKLIAPLK
jgi:hypothetical protein